MNETNNGDRYYGKYRATVFNNIDPEQRGRIQAIVPDVLGLVPSSWAMPCLPIAGKQMGVYMVPQIGSGVWIEFEQGDSDYPIWTGCFWGIVAEVPALALAGIPANPNILVQTAAQNSIMLSDMPPPTGGIMLKSGASTIIVGTDGIRIIAPKIEINGLTIINQGALTVTL
ncbi:MAG: baseplate assembly protein [Pyrinomonadaceae bacterium]|nr:baseplate assembly protein [Pyrinomonadaceae bacterium]